MLQHGVFSTIHKYYTVEEWKDFAKKHADVLPHVAVSCGVSDADFEKLEKILVAVPDVTFICLDVANGYTQQFVDIVRKTRNVYPSHTIIVSSVVENICIHNAID